MMEYLESLCGNSAHYVTTKGDSVMEGVFRDGSNPQEGENWARSARRLLGGNGKIYRISNMNDCTSIITKHKCNHDFLIFEKRFIVDGWVKNIPIDGRSFLSDRAVFDLRDPNDSRKISNLYGSSHKWNIRSDSQIREDLSRLEALCGNEDNFNVCNSDDSEAIFPDGKPWFSCDNWAINTRRLLGNQGQIRGFSSDENPKSLISNETGGHTFLLIYQRFIIDGWVKNVQHLASRAVFDLKDPNQEPEIAKLYGKRRYWKRLLFHEEESLKGFNPLDFIAS